MKRSVILALLVVGIGLSIASELPVHVEESHAGAFYHLVETLPLKEAHTLVLVDAHSDASGIAGSDAVREAIRQGPTVEHRAALLRRWREKGRIQCFDWLEPLMPLPVEEVIWVPKVSLAADEARRLEADAREYLEGYTEALPRAAGSVTERYRVMSLESFEHEAATWSSERKVVVSVDLDFFTKTTDAEIADEVERVMRAVFQLRGLVDVTAALSSPYLRDAAQGERLLGLFLDSVWRVPQARVSFEPFAKTGPDRSLMARMLERRGERLPRLELETAGPFLRSLLLANWQADEVRHEPQRAGELLTKWAADPFLPQIEVLDAVRRHDGTWGLVAGGTASLRLKPEPVGARVRWRVLRAMEKMYRLSTVDLGFASGAPRWLRHGLETVAEGAAMGVLPQSRLAGVLDAQLGCGTLEVVAEVERDGQVWRSPSVILCVKAVGTMGARAAWSEQFGLPYLFDSRQLQRGWRSGPETRWGADCANFITQGLRDEGWLLPWGSPADVLPHLVEVQGIEPERETLLYFGKHLAAVWEDHLPLGVLNAEDVCAHHLEGLPEILSYEELCAGRRKPRLMQVRRPERPIKLVFAGDVMLGRGISGLVAQGKNPLLGLKTYLDGADVVIGNLECVIAKDSVSYAQTRQKLVAPPEAAECLREVGFDAMSLANNHGLDLGKEGREVTRAFLEKAGLKTLVDETHYMEVQRQRLAVLAWDDSAAPDTAVLLKRVEEARKKAALVIVMPHWGTEHRLGPDERQVKLAAELLEAGADLIVGSGPHVVQRLQTAGRRCVAFSLGNTLFDGPSPDAEWSRGALLEVTIEGENMKRARLLPMRTDPGGQVSLEDFNP